ncbi:PIG-P [Neoconidiobolus thromboides FSU 785]|nr:PIG-P [Neoconidiobolus thromboides FSU 785]
MLSNVHADGVRSNFVEGSIWLEYYGYFLYVITKLGFAIYFIWAFVPDKILEEFKITYYPSKYWSLAIPAFSTIFCVYFYILFLGYILLKTPSFDNINYLTDSQAVVIYEPKYCCSENSSEIHDISMEIVNKCCYY